jgi:hypothetical protein
MLIRHFNPHVSSFRVGMPNPNPIGKMMPTFRPVENYAYSSIADVKKEINKSLERPKK